ncbi:MAG: tetratricopeptide repeat protein [Bacteroidetes bacterium]|nr:tetratricopeptide repeat protein [Bacteroidota bacterium]
MEWICSCFFENDERVKTCKQCGNLKPLNPNDLSLNYPNLSVNDRQGYWYLLSAYNHYAQFEVIKNEIEDAKKLKPSSGTQQLAQYESIINSIKASFDISYNQCLELLNLSNAFSGTIQITIPEKEMTFTNKILKAKSYYQKGFIYYLLNRFNEAIESLKLSLEISKQQITLFLIARCYEMIPLQMSSWSSSAKQAEAIKKHQEPAIEYYTKAFESNPFTECGLESGIKLMEKYLIKDLKP